MKFSIKDFSSKCDQIHRKLRIWSHLLEKSLTENFIFCAVIWVNISNIINSLLCNVLDYKETIQLICSPNQLAGFYKIASTTK